MAQTLERTFSRIADAITEWTGGVWATLLAVSVVLIWLIGLPFAGVANQNYQLIINSTTTVLTFIMIFLVQHSTNRGTRAVQLKLDQIIAALDAADNKLIGAEERSEAEIKSMQSSVKEALPDV